MRDRPSCSVNIHVQCKAYNMEEELKGKLSKIRTKTSKEANVVVINYKYGYYGCQEWICLIQVFFKKGITGVRTGHGVFFGFVVELHTSIHKH